MSRLIIFGFCLLTLLSSSANAFGAISPEKAALIDELIKASNEEKLLSQNIELYLSGVGQALIKGLAREGAESENARQPQTQVNEVYNEKMPQIQKFYDLLKQRINLTQIAKDICYPLYDSFYTEEDLREMIKLSQDPVQGHAAFKKTRAYQKYQGSIQRFSMEYKLKIIEVMDPLVKQVLQEVGLEEYYVSDVNVVRAKLHAKIAKTREGRKIGLFLLAAFVMGLFFLKWITRTK